MIKPKSDAAIKARRYNRKKRIAITLMRRVDKAFESSDLTLTEILTLACVGFTGYHAASSMNEAANRLKRLQKMSLDTDNTPFVVAEETVDQLLTRIED